MGRHQRLADLADVTSADLVVADLGCGTGRTVRALLGAPHPPRTVHAVDATSGLDDDLLHDPRVVSRVADLDQALPFADASIDRIVSMNVLESLVDPAAFLQQCRRVLRVGGVAVIGHSDFDTALFTSPDDGLTRLLVDRFVAEVPHWQTRADGFMGRKLLGLGVDGPLTLVDVHSWADPHRRFDEGSLAWKISMGMLAAVRDDPELTARAAGWVEAVRSLADDGRFLFCITDVVVVLRRDS